MADSRNSRAEAYIVFFIIVIAAALLSAYLTFWVQFEREKELPEKKTKAASLQTLQVKDQERRRLHDQFHLGAEDVNLDAWANRSSCIVCHSPYPHGKNKQAMAIMNLHTEFLTCHSCHIKHEQAEELSFGWVSPAGFKPEGKPYGTSIDPDTGYFAATDNHCSKLTPLQKINGLWKPILSEDGAEKALKYIRETMKYTAEQKKQIEDELHLGTELKEFVKCSQCHSDRGIMNFKELGFDAARTNQLQKMEVGGMLTNYDTFYFPEFFEKKFK